MNVLNSLQNSTSNLIHLSIGPEPNTIPNTSPSLIFFTIINPNLIENNNSESVEVQKQQIVCFISFEEREISDNEKVKHVGLIRGLNDFALKFLSEDDGNNEDNILNHIDTDKSRIVVGRLENDFWFICGFRFGTINGEFVQRGLAPPNYLINLFEQGHKLFFINFGSLEDNLSISNGNKKIESWWKTWLLNRFEFSSSFNMNDKGFLNLLDGHRVSSVIEPVGFIDNLRIKVDELIESNQDIQDLFVLNTNWTPSKNFGSIFVNPKSPFKRESLNDLLNIIETLDFDFGLSTYSLTSSNIPSLKSYTTNLKRLNSIAADGTLFDRSLLEPALFLHDQLTNKVFNPFTTAFTSVTNFTTSILPNPMNLVPPMPNQLVPKMNMSFFGLGSSTNEASNTEGSTDEETQDSAAPASASSENSTPSNGDPLQPVESTAESHSSNISIQEGLEMADKTGNFLLGYTKDKSIIIRDIYMRDAQTNMPTKCKLVIYELNAEFQH
ncbi:unnamed protein product [Ambrosiozyma monospora]|uniref:Unnamed protein product n=1 Tax=Ambrosiozyma monospora TaxID=43982 RepID=A0ACB5SSW1_AMBMO|nr:unnamed protein product [Ambrosiozyma monospora]